MDVCDYNDKREGEQGLDYIHRQRVPTPTVDAWPPSNSIVVLPLEPMTMTTKRRMKKRRKRKMSSFQSIDSYAPTPDKFAIVTWQPMH